jgi:Cbb3-type cytochrome oxidase, subunit 3
MAETYVSVASFSQFWGLMLFALGFACVLIYALKPSKKQVFDAAARVPLQED